MDLGEIKKRELAILIELANFCDRNNLKYYLAGGTLLGAVRHQGFIPWDDDIDVIMPRPDYDRLIALTNKNLNNDYLIEVYEGFNEYPIPFMKIIDKNSMVDYNLIQGRQSLWIDVFPMDGMPSNKKLLKKHLRKIDFWDYLLWQSLSDKQIIHNKIKKITKRVLFAPVRGIGGVFFVKQITNVATRYKFEECEYVGCAVGKYGEDECIKKDRFIKRKKVKFEDCYFYISEGYDEYLSNLYGDYLKIPTEDERREHLIRN